MTTDSDIPPAAAKPRVRTPKAAAAPTLTQVTLTPAKTVSKSDTVIKLLLRAKGATPTELIAATDWQPHSLRAFLSGLRKKGREVIREERKGGGYAYRIIVAPAPATTTGSEGEPPPGADSGTPSDAAGA